MKFLIRLIPLFSFTFLCSTTWSQDASVTIAEQLGYPRDAKLLIIHADDAGVSHAENIATIAAMEDGIVNSASIMVPCPWFPEIAAYASQNSEKDFGLHLTVTSEWKNYKWSSASSKNEVKSLINPNGYFYPLVDSVVVNSNARDVEKEINAQIEKALKYGIDVTHLDAHMGAVMSTPEFLEAYIKKGREYRVPVLLSNDLPALEELKTRMDLTSKDVIVDHLYQASPETFKGGMEAFYEDLLNNLEPGLSCFLIHLAFENEEMKAVTIDHPDWGARWRQEDYDFFTSQKSRDLLEKNNIVLVTWREIRDKIVRAQ
ncbi:polysaccharide deacetylase family protein [Zunongwangia sp. F260]|uniref:Polysaccharide deacetylase family protein n=1 Tax=Autumnicola lenta TaxID=3075593 RepID=A0ABU3CMN6_9FLAO|nr:polysaccharide deacetylase family protein [Zunongwangia sp. F260]MDT0647615.1 polysaccharide deacetylase family protein [Zunongwangia sp. F260]